MLDVRDLSKRFGGHHAVRDVCFRIAPGTVTGLIGPNGAGKSTLFNLIAGATSPTRGQIHFEGRRIDGRPPHRVLQAGIGRTFQIPRPFPALTVLENLMLAAPAQAGERFWANWLRPGVVADEEGRLRARARELLEWLELDGLAGSPARILSGGQRKLLELGRVLMAGPRLILLDEPAAGVNPTLLATVVARIAELHRRGVTFLIVEHNMDVVAELCRPILVMAGGRLILEGDPETVRSDPRVIEAYLGGAAA